MFAGMKTMCQYGNHVERVIVFRCVWSEIHEILNMISGPQGKFEPERTVVHYVSRSIIGGQWCGVEQ